MDDGARTIDKVFVDKMLRRRRTMRQSLCNFHFDQVLPDIEMSTGRQRRTSTAAYRRQSSLRYFSRKTQDEQNTIDPVRIDAMRRAIPWIERVAVMRMKNLSIDHELTKKVVEHLKMCYSNTGKCVELARLQQSPERYLSSICKQVHRAYKSTEGMQPTYLSTANDRDKKLPTVSTILEAKLEKTMNPQPKCRARRKRYDTSLLSPLKLRPVTERIARRKLLKQLSSDERLRRPETALGNTFDGHRPVSEKEKSNRIRPLSRSEYFDIVKEIREVGKMECEKKRGALSATVPSSLLENIRTHVALRLRPEPTVARRKYRIPCDELRNSEQKKKTDIEIDTDLSRQSEDIASVDEHGDDAGDLEKGEKDERETETKEKEEEAERETKTKEEKSATETTSPEKNVLSIELSHFSLGSIRQRLYLDSVAGDFDRIESLNMRGNRMVDCDIASLLRRGLEMPRLRSLDLSENEFGRESANSLRVLLDAHSTLESLSISKCNISDQASSAICDHLFSRENESGCALVSLDLGGNRIRDVGLKALASALELKTHAARRLRNLNLSNMAFSQEGGEAIARYLATSPTLEVLNLESTALGRGQSLILIARALEENANLTSLNVAFNNLGPEQTIIIAQAFSTHPRLASLNMSGNPIDEVGLRSLMRSILVKRSPLDTFMRWTKQRDTEAFVFVKSPPRFPKIDVVVEQCTFQSLQSRNEEDVTSCDVLALSTIENEKLMSFRVANIHERAFVSEIVQLAGLTTAFDVTAVRHGATTINLKPVTSTISHLSATQVCMRCGSPGHDHDQCKQIHARCASICLNCGARNRHETEECDSDYLLPGTMARIGVRKHYLTCVPCDGTVRLTLRTRTYSGLRDVCVGDIERRQRTMPDAVVDALIRVIAQVSTSPQRREDLLRHVLRALIITDDQVQKLLDSIFPPGLRGFAHARECLKKDLQEQTF